jgi:hypothetical protein
MANDKIEVTFECQFCGGTVLELPEEYTDDSLAKCNDCGTDIGRWGDIKAEAMKRASADTTDIAKRP